MIQLLRDKIKTLALADAIIEQEWQYRYFSFNSKWTDSEEMGSFRNGCGGEWFLWLSGNLAGYKCFSPEDGLMSDIEQVKEMLPSSYHSFITEPAFSMDHATCIWYLNESEWVKYGLDVKWLIDLKTIINWTAKDYHSWAVDYYEKDIDLVNIERLFKHQFNEELVRKLNPEIDINELKADMLEIGLNS